MSKVNLIWRTFSTATCFALFGIGGVVLTLTVLPIQRLMYRNAEERQLAARKLVHKSFQLFLKFMSISGTSSFSLEDSGKLNQLNGNLVIANHPCLIDVVVLISLIPNADCVIKAELFSNPFIRGVVRSTGYISNSDPQKIIEDCKATLERGNNLIIFPEGTRTEPNMPVKFLRTPANIALRSGAQIFMNEISVVPSTLTKQERWYNIPAQKFLFRLCALGEFKYTIRPNESLHRQSKRLTQNLEDYYNKHLGKN